MKVLHIASGSLNGGAARGALWLHQALLRRGVASTLLSNDASAAQVGVQSTTRGAIGRVANRIRRKVDRYPLLLYPKRAPQIFSCGFIGFDFRNIEAFASADVLHLHWVAAGFVNLRHLSTVDKPVVWTMRDMWPFTGGCHQVAGDCKGYLHACGRCPHLASNSDSDLSRLVLNRKRRLMPKNLTAVGISTWLTENAARSAVLANSKCITIRNGVETSNFYREKRSGEPCIPPGKFVICAGAQNLLEASKGSSLLLEAIQLLDPSRYHLLLFGRGSGEVAQSSALSFTALEFIGSDSDLRAVYSAADVFVAPYDKEAFGKTLVEAMACETPVVCFDATGPRDIVEHKTNGYRAVPFDPTDLAAGIEWVSRHNLDGRMGQAARKRALTFQVDLVAAEYADLYSDLVGRKTASGLGA